MLDGASGGAIVNKTPQQARDLIAIMAANSQQFGSKVDNSRRVNELNVSSLEVQISQLTSLVWSIVVGNVH